MGGNEHLIITSLTISSEWMEIDACVPSIMFHRNLITTGHHDHLHIPSRWKLLYCLYSSLLSTIYWITDLKKSVRSLLCSMSFSFCISSNAGHSVIKWYWVPSCGLETEEFKYFKDWHDNDLFLYLEETFFLSVGTILLCILTLLVRGPA